MRFVHGIIAAAFLTGAPVAAQTGKAARPPEFQKLVACRTLSDPGARLACFDREAAAVDAAEAGGGLVVVDRAQLRATRRSLFGLPLPRLPLLGNDGEETEDLEATVRGVSVGRDGKWVLQLGDSTWRATEAAPYQDDPKVGESVRISRGSLGSFKLSVAGRRAVRAVRVR